MRAFNPDAYQAYSKGRFFWNKRTEEGLKKAIGFFQQAVDKDPDYALAWDGLADSWLPRGWYGYLSPAATFPHAKVAVTKALSLDDSLAEAHTSLAFVNLYYDRDWVGAEREFRRAIDLNPNYANGHHWYGEFLSLVGRHEQAIEESQRARDLDPLSSIPGSVRGIFSLGSTIKRSRSIEMLSRWTRVSCRRDWSSVKPICRRACGRKPLRSSIGQLVWVAATPCM